MSEAKTADQIADEEQEYLYSIVEMFDTTVDLFWYEKLPTRTFLQIASELNTWGNKEKLKDFWRDWPTTPTVFPLFFRPGASALTVAFTFCVSTNAAIQFAKVKTVGGPKDYMALDDESANGWKEEAIRELRNTCKFDDPIVRFQEVGMFRMKISQEADVWYRKKGYLKEGTSRESDSGPAPFTSFTPLERQVFQILTSSSTVVTFQMLRDAWQKDVSESAIEKVLKQIRKKLDKSIWQFSISRANYEAIWIKQPNQISQKGT